jgi:dienelactone hydrolase
MHAMTDSISIEPLRYQIGGAEFTGIVAQQRSQSGLRPGIMVVHDAWGLGNLIKLKARKLAELGYVAFGVDLYGAGVLPKSMDECRVQLDRFRAEPDLLRSRALHGLEVLKSLANVDGGRIAAVGFCFGGMTVLEMARAGADCNAIVSFHGLLGTSGPAASGSIKAKLLVCTGADDPMVPASDVSAFLEEMRNAAADCQTIIYSGAKHSFANPFASNNPGIAHHPAADERSWQAMRTHFAEVFGTP